MTINIVAYHFNYALSDLPNDIGYFSDVYWVHGNVPNGLYYNYRTAGRWRHENS